MRQARSLEPRMVSPGLDAIVSLPLPALANAVTLSLVSVILILKLRYG